MTDFDKILNTTSPGDRDNLMGQALKRREYNRRYQAKLREVARFATLERRVDQNLDYVIGYIKRKYADEYKAYVLPKHKKTAIEPDKPALTNWLIMARPLYKSKVEAYEVAGVAKTVTLKEFEHFFDRYYVENDRGEWVQS